MVLSRKWILKNNFEGFPKAEDFELVEEELGSLKENEIQFRSLFLSVDPYMRPFTAWMEPPFVMIGRSVAEVEESKHSDYPKGAIITIMAGWVERGIINPDNPSSDFYGQVNHAFDIGVLSKSLLLGAIGDTGNTAYFGLLEICKPRAGETVVVTTAAGAVGSLVGQIAKIKGCKVIGYTGTDEKCNWLKEIGFDEVFNYKNVDIAESLTKSAPEGVDCYFDNVGGEIAIAVMSKINARGRVAVCGSLSHYNDVGGYTKVSDALPLCLFKELKVEGFLVTRWKNRYMEGLAAMSEWISKGDIRARETIVEGFEKMPNALMGLFTGDNIGKMIVKA